MWRSHGPSSRQRFPDRPGGRGSPEQQEFSLVIVHIVTIQEPSNRALRKRQPRTLRQRPEPKPRLGLLGQLRRTEQPWGPGVATDINNLAVSGEDPVGEKVLPKERPDVFDRVQFGRIGRQDQERSILGYGQVQTSTRQPL